jgi:Carbohydrate esterase, sialic acid-specific acetylesterase/Secretion system C-terminal sorting domain/Ig-like domain CHU_C associated
MIYKKGIKFIFLFVILLSSSVFAQIDLTMPVNRMVYQRSKQNTATIYVGGSFSGQFDKIEARLTLLDGTGNPKTPLVQTAWLNIVNNPSKGNFLGSISNQQAGWYKLEVRALQGGTQVGDISNVKVGIGEVIVAAGQSNAEGDVPNIGPGLQGAKDDRVNCVNLLDKNINSSSFKYPEISHMDPLSRIAPSGLSSWCYGPLGDLIAKNWDVPVIFFNGAIGNSNITAWRAGAQFSTTEFDDLHTPPYDFTKGEPFIHLKKTLNYYCSLMGVRTVLWHQGEVDNFIFLGYNGSDAEVYKSNLKQLIEYSRTYTDKDISWVIAKASFNGSRTNSIVTDGQQLTIDIPNFNVFAGPSTDQIQPSYAERDGGVHFWGQGLIDLANGWFNSMNNNNFLLNSKPQPATPPQLASISNCVNNNQVTVQLPNGFTNYSWYTDNYNVVTNNQSVTAINSKYLVPYMKDGSNKNFIFSPPINFTPAKLSIITDRSPTFCDGQTMNIIANTFNNNYNWSNNTTAKAIPIKTEGTYELSVNSQDVYGCVASAKASYTVKINQLPPSPKIISDSSPSICEGTSVTLRPEVNQPIYENVWTTGSNDPTISINKGGKYSLNYRDKNNCESLPSNAIEVEVHPNPVKPDIVAGGTTTFCADKFVTLATSGEAAFEWQVNGVKIPTYTTQFINANLPGVYKAKVYNKFGCPSDFSSEIKVTTLALPEAPSISKSGPIAFCAGNEVSLTANSSVENIKWNSNGIDNFSTNRQITINSVRESQSNTNTTYYARVTDGNGCISVPSEKVVVSIRANPSTHRVDAVGTFTLGAKTPILGLEGTIYNWYFNGEQIIGTDKNIKVIKPGNYRVLAKIPYVLPNSDKLECVSELSPVFDYNDNSNTIFSVYPNPSYDGFFTLETKQDFSSAQLQLFTPRGQEIMNQYVNLFNERKILDLRVLPGGEYKLKLKSGTTEITKSIVIIR